MLLRSGRTYSPDHLDMEFKLDLILREPQDLKLRVEGAKTQERTQEMIPEIGEWKTPIGVEMG